MVSGSHTHAHDDGDGNVCLSVNGELKRRDEAAVLVFDSGFLMGDGAWEGLRLSSGRPRATRRGYHPVF